MRIRPCTTYTWIFETNLHIIKTQNSFSKESFDIFRWPFTRIKFLNKKRKLEPIPPLMPQQKFPDVTFTILKQYSLIIFYKRKWKKIKNFLSFSVPSIKLVFSTFPFKLVRFLWSYYWNRWANVNILLNCDLFACCSKSTYPKIDEKKNKMFLSIKFYFYNNLLSTWLGKRKTVKIALMNFPIEHLFYHLIFSFNFLFK